jgi:hypothetical protein
VCRHVRPIDVTQSMAAHGGNHCHNKNFEAGLSILT